MHAKTYWGDIPGKNSDLPGEWSGAVKAITGARQVYEMLPNDGYHAFASAGNDIEKWAVMLLWRDDDREHVHTLWVYEGPEPGFDPETLRVGL